MATKDIGSLRTKLSFEDQGADKTLTGFKRDLKGLRSEMNLAKSSGKDYTNSLKGMRSQSDILTRRLKTQKEQVQELKRRYEESKRVNGETSDKTKEMASQYNNAQAAMNRTEQQLSSLNAEIKRQESPWTKLGESMTTTGQKMQDIGKGMTDFGKSYSMKVTAPIVAGGTAIFKASMDYESAFAGVRKTVDATEDQFATLSTGIREMSKELPASATEIAGVAETAGQLGIKTEDILKFTRTMVDLGVATNMSSEEAATSLARLANITQMPMDQVDKLGSTVVDLGNNLATTEQEIVEMGLRLAGAGDQVGMTEAQILGFSGALSSVGIAAEAGGSAFSKVMINMGLAAERGGEELEAFAKVSGVSASEFKKSFEKDAAGAMIKFIEGLGEVAEEGDSAIGILDEMGITEVRMRDALLRAAGASDVFSDALDIGSNAWEENIALTNEAEQRYGTTESQLKIMWNRIKDVAITLGDALVPAVMSAIDAAEPFIEKIESGAQAFADMDEEQQRTIMKMVGLVAAIGPASVALGGLTTGIGGLLKAGGGVATMLGKGGGAGLLGRFGMMGTAGGPVGLAIAGTAALGVTLYALSKDMNKLNDVNWDVIEGMEKEVEATDGLIAQFEKLRDKNKLTSDEMLRYMDIMSEIEKTESEKAIKKLTDEQQELLKKSGLTNDEMNKFVDLNNEIVEKSPDTAKAISDEGNAFADNLDILKDLNAEKREEMIMAAGREVEKALENETQLLNEQEKLTKDINSTRQEMKDNEATRLSLSQELTAEESKLTSVNNEIKTLKQDMQGLDGTALTKAESKLALLELQKQEQQGTVESVQYEIYALEDVYDKLSANLKENRKDLDVKKEKLKETEKLKNDYEQLILKQAGINAEQGKGLQQIDKEIQKNKEAKRELDRKRDAGEKINGGYDKANSKLSTQRDRLINAKNELEKINTLAGQTIYDKRVTLKTDPTLRQFNLDLASTVSKKVKIVGVGGSNLTSNLMERVRGYAVGTDNHPGGAFVAGEEGYELGRMGNRWEMLNMGLYDRPAGYEVFTHDESKKIISALNSMPAYATGATSPGESSRVVGQLNNQQHDQVPLTGEAVVYTTVVNQMDGRELSRHTYKHTTEFQEREKEVRDSFA